MSISDNVAITGLCFGCALAIVLSYVAYHSIGWAMIAGFFGWLYVLYFALSR